MNEQTKAKKLKDQQQRKKGKKKKKGLFQG
jgi:hypothetical protein